MLFYLDVSFSFSRPYVFSLFHQCPLKKDKKEKTNTETTLKKEHVFSRFAASYTFVLRSFLCFFVFR